MGFLFGSKDTPWSQEELKRKREVADALLSRSLQTPSNGWEGARAIVDALGARKLGKKADAREGELREDFNSRFNSAFSGGGGNFGAAGGGSYAPPLPRSQFNLGETETPEQKAAREANSGGTWNGGAVQDMQPNMFSTFGNEAAVGGKSGYDMGSDAPVNIADGIKQTAAALGIDPVDLATAISYETAGTFDPMKAGPTTQWGQHKGLIQFGEPQAQQYGVDWNDPVGSQLGPDGAVAKYLTGAGVRPGMGMLDIYSAINAGSVGRYGASDANNGGAPGTVADKVNTQMAGHREKALALLQGGGGDAPMVNPNQFGLQDSGPAPQMPQEQPTFAMGGGAGGMNFDIGTLAGLAADPYASPEQKAIINALIQQQTQAMDPMYRSQLEEQRLKVEGMKTPQSARPLTPEERAAWGIPPEDKTPYALGENGIPKPITPGGTNVNVNTGGGPELGKLSTDYGYVLDANGKPVIDEVTGLPKAAPVPGSPAALEAEAAANKTKLANEDTTQTANVVLGKLDQLDKIITESGTFNPATGFGAETMSGVGGTNAANAKAVIDTIKANVGFETLAAMRAASPTGGALGAISDSEMTLLTSTLASLAQTQDPEQMKQHISELRQIYGRIMEKAAAYPNAGQFGMGGGQPAGQPAKTELIYNPATGELE